MRDQLKDEISEQYQAKLALEAAVAEATEQMTRAKNLYAEYTSRVEDMTARERVLMAGEADVQARQEQVGRREATLKTREEWISKREGQFRVQQRALENAQLLPRGSLMTPPVAVAASSAGSGSPRGSGAAGGGAYRGVGAAGSSPREGSASGWVSDGGSGSGVESAGAREQGREQHSLAHQVMLAQASYSSRGPAGMAGGGGGKLGAKEAAQRDYKAILSTNPTSDPQEDRCVCARVPICSLCSAVCLVRTPIAALMYAACREIAKAARRRDMIKGLIPSKLRKAASSVKDATGGGAVAAKKASPASSAASSLDMNAI